MQTTSLLQLIGNTPLVKIDSLSQLTGNNIYLKCENMNYTGSIKDRAAKQMVLDAIEQGVLKPGMTIVEGTAGNTGISLAMIAKSLGYGMLVVIPNDQAKEKMDMVRLYGAELLIVDAVPFTDLNHFYHTAKRIAQQNPDKYWHANQFDNLSNFKAHYEQTGPEIFRQLNGKVDVLVGAAGTGGTIAGCCTYLKEMLSTRVVTVLVDPTGSGLVSFINTAKFVTDGASIVEGVGIMRLVENFAKGKDSIDEAFNIPDSHVVRIAKYVRDNDGIPLGSSAALNVCGALRKSVCMRNECKNIVTFLCDGGERTLSKLYNDEFLNAIELSEDKLPSIEQLIQQYETDTKNWVY